MNRRRWLWLLLVTLIAALLIALVWLVGRFEQSQYEDQLERDAAQWRADIRVQLARNTQQLRAFSAQEGEAWDRAAALWLKAHPEMLRLERRGVQLQTLQTANTPFTTTHSAQGIFKQLGRQNFQPEVAQACALAQRTLDNAYSRNYFVPQGNGLGFEVTDFCLTTYEGSQATGYLIATYALEGWLKEWIAPQTQTPAQRQHEISLVETDGARLSAIGTSTRRGDRFVAQSLLDLPGNTLVLRVETWTRAPYWLANTATALVLALAIALAAVLWLLFRDTRKRLRAEESLRQSQERLQRVARLANLGEMASMLSHELNQPLAAIASYAVGGLNVLAMPAPDLADIQTALERIAGQSERAGKVIKSVNEFVRSRETERVAIAPQALLDSVFPLLRLQAQQLHARLSIRVESALPTVWCDKTLIEQVVINLVRNGLQAMQDLPVGAPRELTLRIQRSGPRLVEFDVADTGPGLASEVAAQLFTPFFTTKNDGIGLGLSLCRTVVEQHGGSLSYTTQQGTASTGTTFQFRLMTYEAAHRLPHHTEDPTTIDRH